jgi:hypothetical protein
VERKDFRAMSVREDSREPSVSMVLRVARGLLERKDHKDFKEMRGCKDFKVIQQEFSPFGSGTS